MSTQIPVTRAATLKPHPDESKLGFGMFFTDHMFSMDYDAGKGWHDARIEPYGRLPIEPSTMVLHYAQAIFDGHKAYRTPSGAVQLFRPRDHLARLNRSAKRMCIPLIDEAMALDAMKQLILLDQSWVPSAAGTSLYIRPMVLAMDHFLGVRASDTYRFCIFLSPVGAYFPEGFKPVKIWVAKEYVRAFPGGLGETKTPANYAASLYATELARSEGYPQVLWLDGMEHRYVEEVGAMNICFVINGELVTAPLQGTILPGITRDSVLTMARTWKMPVAQRRITIDEVIEANQNGSLQEVFGCGTAAVISPVGTLKYGDQVITMADGKVGPVATRLYQALTDIQYGRVADPYGWMVPLTT